MVYPIDVLRENYLFYSNEATPDLPLKRGADFVLVESSNAVVHSMKADKRWVAVYEDKEAILFAGPSPAGKRLSGLLEQGLVAKIPASARGRFP